MRTRTFALELLESRIAPASLQIVNSHTATYTDVDGDHVTLRNSSGDLHLATFNTVPSGVGDQLQMLDLTGNGDPFFGTNVTVSVSRVPGGDGEVNIGAIEARGVNLGAVTVPGDLGHLNAGSDSAIGFGMAVEKLTVDSIGRFGTDTQGSGGSLQSDIVGELGSLVVKGDIKDAFINLNGPDNNGSTQVIGSVTIGGSLIGGAAEHSGEITGEVLKTLKIGGDVIGGTAPYSGYLHCSAAKVIIGGSLIGGSGESSGLFDTGTGFGGLSIAGDLRGGAGMNSGSLQLVNADGLIHIGGDIIGGSGEQSAFISFLGSAASVSIGGSILGGSADYTGAIVGEYFNSIVIGRSLVGGTADHTGFIQTHNTLGKLKIGGDLRGGSIGDGADTLSATGYVTTDLHGIGLVTIGGSIISGTDGSADGSLVQNASISSLYGIESLTVGKNIVGNSTSPVIISAVTQDDSSGAIPHPGKFALGSITVGGRVENALFLAGYDPNLNPVNGAASIGKVTVAKDWIASSLVAGVKNSAFPNFGTAADSHIPLGQSSAAASSIASVNIRGLILGTSSTVSGTDHFGFVAQAIGSFTYHGSKLTLPAAGNFLDLGTTRDVSLHLVS